MNLKDFLDSSGILDAQFSPDLALAIFYPKAPLHDGGMIIADDSVAGAVYVFPVTEREYSEGFRSAPTQSILAASPSCFSISAWESSEVAGAVPCLNYPDANGLKTQ